MYFRQALIATLACALACVPLWGQEKNPPATKKGPAVAPAAAPVAGPKLDGNYKQDTPEDMSTKEFKDLKAAIPKFLNGSTPLSEQELVFDSYYLKYFFPYMTQTDSTSLQKLPEVRVKFIRDTFEVTNQPAPVHAHIVNLTLTEMLKIAKDDYHPAVRYNAMMIVALLNDQETVKLGANKMTPEPCARALPQMVDIYIDPKQLDLVRMAALWGMVRHLEGDNYRQPAQRIAPELRAEVLSQLTTLATQKNPPPFRTKEGHGWMRRKAVEGLGFATYEVANPAVVKTLDALLADDQDAVALRSQAALALGRVHWSNGWPGGPKYDLAAALANLQQLVADAITEERALFEKQHRREEELVGPVGAAATGGAFSGSVGYSRPPVRGAALNPDGLAIAVDPLAYRVEGSRRRLRYVVYALEMSLKGIDDRVKPPANEPRGLAFLAKNSKVKAETDRYDALTTNIDKKWIPLLEEETAGMDRETYLQELEAVLATLRKPAAAPAAAPADPADPADPDPAAAPKAPAGKKKPAAPEEDPLDALPGN